MVLKFIYLLVRKFVCGVAFIVVKEVYFIGMNENVYKVLVELLRRAQSDRFFIA